MRLSLVSRPWSAVRALLIPTILLPVVLAILLGLAATPTLAEKRVGAELGRNQGTVFQDCWDDASRSVVVLNAGDKAQDGACGPQMVVVPGGKFTMGSPESEKDRFSNEGPQRVVTIGQPFAVGKFEVTFAEWDACVADKGCDKSKQDSAGADENWGRETRPVINVSWEDAQAYIKWLNKKTGQRYRLLTEAEWEYAARAGTTTPFSFGETISTDQANYDGNYTYGRGKKGVDRQKTVEVGSFLANAYGLHDMHGNVWEWVEDCWHESYSSAPSDGTAWTTSCSATSRVRRGGSWVILPGRLRAAYRGGSTPGGRFNVDGFRLARTLLTP